MKNSSKLIGVVVAIVVVAAAIWWYMSSGSSALTPVPANENTGANYNTSQTAAVSNGVLTTSSSDTSDAALNADMSSIDTGLNGMNADAAAAASASQN